MSLPHVTIKSGKWLLSGLVLVNVFIWGLTLFSFRHHPSFIGMGLLAWSFGLRHAVDADHIAAIDNTTRKLMSQNQKPISVGTFFSLGHSTIVIIAAAVIALSAGKMDHYFPQVAHIGGWIGTITSIVFLLIMAGLNWRVFKHSFQRFSQLKSGTYQHHHDDDHHHMSGPLTRLFQFAFRLVNKSWHMYFIGFLFGLGFDTATEVGLLAMSATNATNGMNIWLIMLFPALFTAGMALIDTLDSFLMVGAYDWALNKPSRKLYYNLTITGTSIIMAFGIGVIELLNLLPLNNQGTFGSLLSGLSDNWSVLGGVFIVLFALCWGGSLWFYKRQNYDQLSA